MAAALSEKTGLSLGLVITLGVMLAAGVGTFAKTQSDVGRQREETARQDAALAELKAVVTKMQEEQSSQGRQLIEYRSDTRYIIASLAEVKAQLATLTSSPVRQVRAIP